MLSLLGAPALSEFRLGQLLGRIRLIEPTVASLASRFVHFVDVSEKLGDAQLLLLNRLLTYGPSAQIGAEPGVHLTVTPRIGTISPWFAVCTTCAASNAERSISSTQGRHSTAGNWSGFRTCSSTG
jgi:phosphoribosylformylglycinamidine synthase